MSSRDWVRLPSTWIDERGLAGLSWKAGGAGSDNTAALMALTAIAHAADQETGIARLTYDDLCDLTGLSRAKASNGLEILRGINVIERGPDGARSTYQLVNYARSHWAKLPVKSMYRRAGRIAAFDDFQLRLPAELEALKLFFLFVARRGRTSNVAHIGYEKIEEYTGIKRGRIKTGLSLLATLSLVYVEPIPSGTNMYGVSNAYRIVGLDTYNHMGTRGRGMTAIDYNDART